MRLPARLVIGFSLLLALAGAVGWGLFIRERRQNDVVRENRRLQEALSRLGNEFRVADIVVTGRTGGRGREARTTFRFHEYDRFLNPLPPREFTVAGDVAYFDALVLKFEDSWVGAGDPLRGRSLHLFRRVFGEYQAPADGFPIDAAGEDGVPDALRVGAGEFERSLWKRFWEFAADPDGAAKEGVRVAQGEAVYLRLEVGRTYRLTIEADGGLNLKAAPISTARN